MGRLLFALVLCFSSPVSAQPVTDPAIHADIEQLLAAMNQALDAEDYDAYVTVWAEDGWRIVHNVTSIHPAMMNAVNLQSQQ